MKQISRLLSFAAAAAMCFSACSPEELKNGEVNVDKFVTVHFGTENTDPASTKATLTPNEGETAFQAAWENGDEIKVKYSNDSKSETATGTTTATWNGTSFESKMPEYTGMWIYDAAYPVPSESDSSVDFGPNRTQKGNAYNSKYDIMIGSAVAENAAAGKDYLGKDIVFQMDRQTAIAYFHFTSELDEAVTSATLKVTNGAIANSSASINEQFKFVAPQENDLTEINLTFEEGTAPSAKDFQLWFNVLPTTYTKMTLTVETETKTFTISKNTAGKYVAGKLYKVKKSGIAWTDKPVTDVITASDLEATNTSYTDFSEVKISSNAVYAGNSAKTSDGAIQLRSDKSTAGIVSTTSGGKVTKVSVEWASNTTNGRVINVYGNTNPYTSASELYSTTSNTNQGTILGTIVCGTSTELVIDGNYPYIGIRSNSGALYLNSVSITWESGSSEPAPDTYTVSCATVPGGTLSADPSKASAGTEVTLTAAPEEGYKFNDNWTVKYADEGTVSVTEGKFTMPAANVTVSGSFSKIDYRITKTAASERGSIVAKKGETVVETAQIGDEITLVATPNEGYELKSWTVVDGEDKSIEVNDNKFTMPASDVTITATFSSSASYTVSFSVNGNVTTKSYKESEKIEFPADPEISGVTFMGWITNAIEGTQAEAPVFVETASAVMGTENITYYAVFATQGTEKVSETIGQTLAYDTWTYSGSTTDKSSYRLFHTDSYIESAEFDLSTLTKVVVYGGTFGGDSYNKLTIGDGTNTWKKVTVSGDKQTGKNTYTDGTPLSGTGKLRITSNSGKASSNGVRISKIEIYVGVYGYTDYCTNVVTLSSVAISGTPENTVYTVGNAFDPAGLDVTGTYSDGSNAPITEGISWNWTPATFTEAGSHKVSVTATVKSVASAAYDVNVTVNTISNTLKATDGTVDVNKTLDVSTLFTSNSDAEVTYTLVENPNNAGTLSGSNFSASAAGTYKVKARQAETAKYSAAEATATITVGGETKYFVKVSSTPADWSGEYLIVYETGKVAFDGSLTTLDAVSNTVSVTISDSKIKATDALLQSTFTINADGTTIQSKSGHYIGNKSNSNALTGSSTELTNTSSIESNGDFKVISEGGAYLRYNATSGQTRFRYFKSSSYTSQKAIQLYKLEN